MSFTLNLLDRTTRKLEQRMTPTARRDNPHQDPNHLAGQKVLVMGLGLLAGGVAAARYAVAQGAAQVTVTDLRSAEMLAPSIAKLDGLPIRYVLGRHNEADFLAADVIVRNPNVRRDSPYLALARDAGKRIEMEIAWFMRACPGPIAGITGTRGKTTTTILLHHILTYAGMEPLLGGNIGGIETLTLLPRITPDHWTVLELGNWILEGLHSVQISPRIAVFTNLLPDHLDAYDSMEDYGAAKCAVFRYQRPDDIAIFNADNDYTRRYGGEAASRNVWFYSPESATAWPRGENARAEPFAYASDIHLRGAHNFGNVQAAALAAERIGVPREQIHGAIANFRGVPHRLEVVRELDGVTWVNDSASTAPVASIAALASFSEPIVLIAGGNSKRLDVHDFASATAERCKRVVLLAGNASADFATLVRAACAERGLPDCVDGPYDNLGVAVGAARAAAAPGDVVLLSPGFTSFGMFLHEFDRGDRFRMLVRSL
jgi:UDP-N-acetylmuramoylalanine--D-glutamate ligase